MPSVNLERLKVAPVTVTWSASTTSGVVAHIGGSLYSLFLPATFSGTSISFLAEEDSDGSYNQVYKDGSLFSVTVTAGKRNIITADFMAAGGNFKIVSNASETGTGYLHAVV